MARAKSSTSTTPTGAILILFYEYFHGDNAPGWVSSHQRLTASSPWPCIICPHLGAIPGLGKSAAVVGKPNQPTAKRRRERGGQTEQLD